MSPLAPLADALRSGRAPRCLAVALFALVPYLLLPAKPLVFDAPSTIVANRVVQSGSLSEILTSDYFGDPAAASYSSLSYRPLVTLTYALEARTLGNAAWVFHVPDMLLHAAAAVALLLLLELLGTGGWAGIGAAALFAVHPIASEAVASAVGRADLMAGLGLLVALVCHLGAGRRKRPWIWDACALASLAAALLSKEYAVAFPLAMVAFDAIVRAGPARDRRDARWPWGFWAGAFLLLAAYVGARWAVLGTLGAGQSFSASDNALLGTPWWVRWSTALAILSHAARLLVFPVGLCHHYANGTLPLVESLLDPRALLPAAAIAIGAGAAIAGLRRRGWAAPPAALALFLFPLLPSLNTLGVTGVLFAERWMYLPAAGLAILAGWALDRVPRRPPWPRIAVAASAGVLVLLAAGTASRVRDWGSLERLAESALRVYPRAAKIWHELGYHLESVGKHAEAVEAVRRSLDLEPADPRAWHNYAKGLTTLGRYREAALAWRRVIELAPTEMAALWVGLGECEVAAGDLEAAAAALAKAYELAPSDAGLRSRLGEIRFASGLVAARAGDLERARGWFSRALDADPLILRRRHEAAVRLEEEKRFEDAARTYREILAASPDNAPTLFNLGRLLLHLSRPDEAIPLITRGLAVQDDPRAREMLSRARQMARAGR